MPELKQYFATNTYRPDESGYAAFETFGRRVGSEYGRAASDIKEIGRTKAATINMLGRWPFNILELEKRESERAMRSAPQQSQPSGGVKVNSRPSSSSITDSQFGARYMPDLAALNEMSEGAAYFGRMVGGGSQLPSLMAAREKADIQYAREQARKERLAYEANLKDYELRRQKADKELDEYNDMLAKQGEEYVKTHSAEQGYGEGVEYGGTSDRTTTSKPDGFGGTITVPDYQPDTSGGDYGGTSSSWW